MISTRFLARLSAIALVAVVAAPAAEAQSLTRSESRARPVVVTQEDIVHAEARAEGFALSGQFAQARLAYREAAMLRERAKESTSSVEWQIANLYFGEGDMLRAAHTLDELAAGAARRGEHEVRAKALLEAAFMYRAAGHRRRASEIARELRAFSADAPIADELRQTIAQRIG